MKNHEHSECEHEQLSYCKKCRVVYCKDCGNEWRENYWNQTYIIDTTKPVPVWTYPGVTYQDEHGTPCANPNINSTAVVCNHVEVS
jgi:hypothetical protein